MEIGVHRWDVDLISDMFNERDRNLILGIPLNDDIHEDFYYWNEDRLGVYTVKIAYNHIHKIKRKLAS